MSLALLGSKFGFQVVSLLLPNCLGMSYGQYRLVLSWYLHQPESHQLSLQQGGSVWDTRIHRSDQGHLGPIKMFLSVPAGPWWIFQPKSSEQSTENTPVDISPPNLRQGQYDHDQDDAQPVLYTNGFYPKWHSCESFGCQCFLYKNCNVWIQMAFTQSGMYVNF